MIWSKATKLKFQLMNSITGRRPVIAAPTAMPVKPDSVMGLSITRLSPKISSRPLVTL